MTEDHEAEMATMLKVFRACIKTGFFPQPDSPCDRKLNELLAKYPDEEEPTDNSRGT